MSKTLHPHLSNALRDLKTRFGVGADELTPDEMFDLVEAVRRVENPFEEANLDLMGIPVKVCEGTYLWRLTAGASVWLDEYAAKWWGDARHDRQYFWALVYAMVNARRKDAFVGLDSKFKAYWAIRRCALGIMATDAEVARAVDAAMGRADPDGGGDGGSNGKSLNLSRIVARLEAQSGIGRDEWLWGRSEKALVEAYNSLVAAADAVSRASGAPPQRMRDEADAALENLAAVKSRISRRVKAERERAASAAAPGAEE